MDAKPLWPPDAPAVVLLTCGLQMGSVFAQGACRLYMLNNVTGDRTLSGDVGQQNAACPQPRGGQRI